jgi:hypothetical protein
MPAWCDVTDLEKKLLTPLALMVAQYCTIGRTLDNKAMHAGEMAFMVLAEYGLLTMKPDVYRFADWTEAGLQVLEGQKAR